MGQATWSTKKKDPVKLKAIGTNGFSGTIYKDLGGGGIGVYARNSGPGV